MGDYTNKLKELNKGISELMFLITLSIEKKSTLERLVKELDNHDNEIIEFKREMVKDDIDILKSIEEINNCNKEFSGYMLKFLDLQGLISQLSYLDELKFELERIHDTLKF